MQKCACLVIAAAALTATSISSPIPAGRMIDWSKAGVPGGIPHRTSIHATIDAAAFGNGTADASAAINSAIAGCPESRVVLLTAGTFRLNRTVQFNLGNGITLRGAGMGKTILRPADGLGAAIRTGETGQSSAHRITGGSAKGSRSITVDNAAGIEADMILDIYQDDDPDFYWTRGLTKHTGQYVMVTAVRGTTIDFEDPLAWSFTLNPVCKHPLPAQGMRWCGVEDLTISAPKSYGGSMIQFWCAYASWIKNVETEWGNGNEHLFFYGNLRCQISGCYVHDTWSTTDGYGIVTGAGYGGPRGGCTATLIENNVFSGLWGATVLETEVGSVIAYNFCRDMRFPGWPDYMMYDFNGNHGPHGMMCLFEGNVGGGGIQQDGYHGSVSHTTYFRNHFSGKHVEERRNFNNTKLIDLCRFSYYQNVVGNVLGCPDWPRSTTGRYEMTGQPDYTKQTCIYRLGYPNMGNNGYSATNPPSNPDDGGLDPKVKQTLFRWGNFDYQNNATRWESSEIPAGVPIPADHDLPATLYLNSKPSWWCDQVPWPPIGPDVNGLTNDIPAKRRFDGTVCGSSHVRPRQVRPSLPAAEGSVILYTLTGRLIAVHGSGTAPRQVCVRGLYLAKFTGKDGAVRLMKKAAVR